MAQTLNMFDLIFIFSTIIIIFIAFLRGFTREFFSVLNWIVAISLVHFLSPYFSGSIKQYFANKIISNIVSSTILFIVIFIITTLTTRRFSTVVKEKIPANADQVLGVIFGFFKAMIIFGFIYGATIHFQKSIYGAKNSMPNWLGNSKFLPVIKPVGQAMLGFTRFSIDDTSKKFMGKKVFKNPKKKSNNDVEELDSAPHQIYQLRRNLRKIKKINEIYEQKDYDKLKDLNNDAKEETEKSGYSKKQIEKMDRLIEIVE